MDTNVCGANMLMSQHKRTQRGRSELRICNHLGGGPVVRAWDQEICSLCGLRFEPCGCSYDDH
jgi:hypothetical protein